VPHLPGNSLISYAGGALACLSASDARWRHGGPRPRPGAVSQVVEVKLAEDTVTHPKAKLLNEGLFDRCPFALANQRRWSGYCDMWRSDPLFKHALRRGGEQTAAVGVKFSSTTFAFTIPYSVSAIDGTHQFRTVSCARRREKRTIRRQSSVHSTCESKFVDRVPDRWAWRSGRLVFHSGEGQRRSNLGADHRGL
jgi:hypothetical protein